MKTRQSPYLINIADVAAVDMAPPSQIDKGGALLAQMVFGSDTSFMVAERETGYHSPPHNHDAEQMNYVIDGSIWVFIGDSGFRAVKGDIFRIPRNAIHWAWVKDPGGCKLFETHTPPLTGDEKMKNGAVSMLGSDEDINKVRGIRNNFPEGVDWKAVEKRVTS
jgi:quercetin dioxygenase-like cupin family protein